MGGGKMTPVAYLPLTLLSAPWGALPSRTMVNLSYVIHRTMAGLNSRDGSQGH
jgi:hypothetical protein